MNETLSSPTEKLSPTGDSAEEADLLRRSKKKTKRGLVERDDATMGMEEDGRESQPIDMDLNGKGPNGQTSQSVKGPARSFKGALTGLKDRVTFTEDEGFEVWDNSRFGALQNLDEESEDEAQEESALADKPDGPTGVMLSSKGKRPQTQTTEAQLQNDKSEPRRGNNTEKGTTSKLMEGSKGKEGSKRQGNQAAESESHTVVRGYDKGSKVVRTTVTEEGNTMKETQTQPEGGDHHQDPPDPNTLEDSSEPGDPMEGQTSSGLGVVLQ
nr:uncharacterized protein LOC109158743 [Ipomoea trifida]